MEYERTDDGQIRAAFAERAGRALTQYEGASAAFLPEERYEATLTICVLQSLLTTCAELIKRKTFDVRIGGVGTPLLVDRDVFLEPTQLGLDSSCFETVWKMGRPLTYRDVLSSLRNVLSHPLDQNVGKYATTGYTTWDSPSGVIEGFTFVHSPWVNRKGTGLALTKRAVLERDLEAWCRDKKDDSLTVHEGPHGALRVLREGKPYVPVMRIRMTVTQIRTFTLVLADFLAHPMTELRARALQRQATAEPT